MRETLAMLLMLVIAAQGRILMDTYSESAELRQLSKQQAEFERQFELIKNDLGKANALFKSASTRPQRIESMQRTIERHRSMLLEASKSLIPPLNLSLCDCEALSPNQKQLIINALNEVRSSIFTLRNSLKKATPCARTRQMQEDLQAQLFIADTIQEVLDSKCKRAALLTPTIWQTNLNAPNWVLGDQTLDDVVDDYYERSVRYDNITNCNINEPFYDGKGCISCPKDQPLFNMYTQKCMQCEQGFLYNSKYKQCLEGGKPAVTKIVCKEDQFLVEATNKCVDLVKCGLGTILDRESNTCRIKRCERGLQLNRQTGECQKINCGSDFYNTETYQCEKYRHCAESYLNRELNKCSPYLFCNPQSQFLNRSSNLCVPLAACSIDQFLDRTTNQCAERVKCNTDTHFYNEEHNVCDPRMKCSEREFYETKSNLCVPFTQCVDKFLNRNTNICEHFKECDNKETVLNRRTNECEKIKDCGNDKFFNRDTLECDAFITCPANEFLNRSTNLCEPLRTCPTNFLDKTRNECVDWVTCEGRFLNRLTNQCDSLATCTGKFYNSLSNSCEEFANCDSAFLDRSSNTCAKWKNCQEKFLNRQTNICEDIIKCSTQQEFYNSTINKCHSYRECTNFLDKTVNACLDFVQCSDKEELDKSINKCVEKPLTCYPDEVLNTDTGKCVKRPVIYRPAAKLTGYVEGKSTLSKYLAVIQAGIDKNPNARVVTCPDSQPYSLLSECTTCNDGLFFLDSFSCGQCKQGHQYDEKMKLCRIRLFLNHPEAKLDLHGLSAEEYSGYEKKIISRNPNAIVSTCPNESPFSVDGSKCIACPATRPLFDVVHSECKQCPANEHYNPEKRNCE